MRLKDLLVEANDTGPVGSFISGFKQGKDLDFSKQPNSSEPKKKTLTNKSGTVDIQINRYQLVDLQMVLQAVLKGNTNILNSQEIEAARELLKQLNNS
jgi:hypothetical protein